MNLALVLDVSGSMADTDGTSQSRLEWAKAAAVGAVNKLTENDWLSVVLFDSASEVLLASAPVTDRESVIARIQSVVTRGSTNLFAGLQQGYDLVSQQLRPDYENRVILLSDAGLNTGVVEESSHVKLVLEHAQEGIGLTAIGMGLNFNQNFIDAIASSQGGNYLFAQEGTALQDWFEQFDYLVSPVAHHFKAHVQLPGYRLKRAYGVPDDKLRVSGEILNVRSLFFTGSDRGGAILLEYEREPDTHTEL